MSKVIKGTFSKTNGSRVRIMYADGVMVGSITKMDNGTYRVVRFVDGKVRNKKLLSDAYRTVARAN